MSNATEHSRAAICLLLGLKGLAEVVGLARYRNFNFIKILAVKEIAAREKFLEL